MQVFPRVIYRFLVVAVIEAFSILLIDWLSPGINLLPVASADIFVVAMSVAIVLAMVNGLVRPFLLLLTLPLNVTTFGFSTLLLNAGMLWLTAYFLPYFEVQGWGHAFLGALLLAVVNTILTSLTTIDDDYSFFEGIVQWLSSNIQPLEASKDERGLVLIEIDGLSFRRLQRILYTGKLPTISSLIENGTHKLSHFDCGLPSQTSSCQAGIMYGENSNIPAFRWFEKGEGRFLVSNNFDDAYELNRRFSNGKGLLRGGTSINNLMSGDARKALLTISMLTKGPEDVDRRSPEDLYLVFLNPYFFTRSVVLTLWDILVELFQAARQWILNVKPRVNRFRKGYPLLRAVANVFLRDLSTNLTILEILRGSPVIYTTYIGYDEIAHHAGPDSRDAIKALKSIDAQVRRILDVIHRKAQRPYDVVLLSDHGQSVGATFQQRYGHSLSQTVEELIKGNLQVVEMNTDAAAKGYTSALLEELSALEQNVRVTRLQSAAIDGMRRAIGKRAEGTPAPPVLDQEVVVGVSGNLAHLYFNLHPERVTIPELEHSYPGLLQGLIEHEGIGLVIAHDPYGCIWAFGKRGARNLSDGEIKGSDPLLTYERPELRVEQILRLASFPNAGDLVLVSTLYPDGQVAAFEELVGSHGGLGGDQTDAFLLHPSDMHVPPIKNAAEVYKLLNERRGLPGQPLQPRKAEKPEVSPWSKRRLIAGIRNARTWLARVLRVMILDLRVFHEIAEDPLMTGPALLTTFVIYGVSGVLAALNTDLQGSPLTRFSVEMFGGILNLLFLVWLARFSGQIVQGKGSFTRTLRTLAFAQVPKAVGWFRIVPTIGPLFALIEAVMRILASWTALQEALHISKTAAALIPIIAIFLMFAVTFAVYVVLGGFALTLETILQILGVDPTHWFPLTIN